MTDLVKEVKLAELDNKTPDVSGLVAKLALTAVENKINEASNLVKKTDYNTKISEIETKRTDHNHDKYITNAEFNEVTTENFAGRLKQANLGTKTNFDDKLRSLSQKIDSNKTEHLVIKNKLKNLKTFDSVVLFEKVILKKMVQKSI